MFVHGASTATAVSSLLSGKGVPPLARVMSLAVDDGISKCCATLEAPCHPFPVWMAPHRQMSMMRCYQEHQKLPPCLAKEGRAHGMVHQPRHEAHIVWKSGSTKSSHALDCNVRFMWLTNHSVCYTLLYKTGYFWHSVCKSG